MARIWNGHSWTDVGVAAAATPAKPTPAAAAKPKPTPAAAAKPLPFKTEEEFRDAVKFQEALFRKQFDELTADRRSLEDAWNDLHKRERALAAAAETLTTAVVAEKKEGTA